MISSAAAGDISSHDDGIRTMDLQFDEDRTSTIKSVDICSDESPSTILFDLHSVLLTITLIFGALGLKCFPAFITVVLDEYAFSYSFVTQAFAIGSFTTMICIILLPQLLYFRANIACFFICIIACIGILILWYFRNNKILFVIGISLVFNVYQLQWGASNAIISSFVNRNDKHKAHKYLSLISGGSWTIASFLFIGVGYIVKMASFWTYLEWLLIVFAVLALLNLLILPRISVNKYNRIHHSHRRIDNMSICNDFQILFSIKEYRVIMCIFTLIFIALGFVYTSFGIWIQRMYNLDEAELGIAVALIEGIGNLVANILIGFFARNSKSNEKYYYKMKLENMMIYFALLLLLSVSGLTIINYVKGLQYLLEYNIVVYTLLCGYFCGSDGVIVGVMILSVTETPQSQQARSSAFVSIINSISLFFGQFAVGLIYTKGGFKLETPILLSIQVILVIVSIYLAYTMKYSRMTS